MVNTVTAFAVNGFKTPEFDIFIMRRVYLRPRQTNRGSQGRSNPNAKTIEEPTACQTFQTNDNDCGKLMVPAEDTR